FYHMFYVLNGETNKSERSKVLIRLSLMRLFAQLNVPLLFAVVPAIILFIQAVTRCFPFLVPQFVTLFLSIHPPVHNLALLLIMPTYRRAIVELV
ncbi:hypothetical protein PMAYCL1PPCAC_20692, partial [Pristionchus mayeri]